MEGAIKILKRRLEIIDIYMGADARCKQDELSLEILKNRKQERDSIIEAINILSTQFELRDKDGDFK